MLSDLLFSALGPCSAFFKTVKNHCVFVMFMPPAKDDQQEEEKNRPGQGSFSLHFAMIFEDVERECYSQCSFCIGFINENELWKTKVGVLNPRRALVPSPCTLSL